jgi:hypothetical protein
LQRGLDPVENALLASGQAHGNALPAYRWVCIAPDMALATCHEALLHGKRVRPHCLRIW